MLFPWIVGHVSQRITVRPGMIVPSLGAVGIILLSVIVFARERGTEPTSKTREARS